MKNLVSYMLYSVVKEPMGAISHLLKAVYQRLALLSSFFLEDFLALRPEALPS